MREQQLTEPKIIMRRLGYTNRASFWDFVHKSGLPFYRINARKFMFDSGEVNAWLESRKVGGVR